jgi:hypothetical protein
MPAKEPLLKLIEPEIGTKPEIGWLENEEVGLEVADRKKETYNCHSWAKLMSVYLKINYFSIYFKYNCLPMEAY